MENDTLIIRAAIDWIRTYLADAESCLENGDHHEHLRRWNAQALAFQRGTQNHPGLRPILHDAARAFHAVRKAAGGAHLTGHDPGHAADGTRDALHALVRVLRGSLAKVEAIAP